MTEVKPISPCRLAGTVVKGFGRGSKLLGIPTANLPSETVNSDAAKSLDSGVYCGWSTVDGKGPYKMVMSVGWNPYFQNTEKTIEPHLLHSFEEDFYGSTLRLVVTGYLRPEANFASLEELIKAIHADIQSGREFLDKEEMLLLSKDSSLELVEGS